MDIRNKIIQFFCEEEIKGGLADNKTIEDVLKHHFPDLTHGSKAYTSTFYLLKDQLKKGKRVEKEHTDSDEKAEEIALDHLWEDPDYYDKLETIEDN